VLELLGLGARTSPVINCPTIGMMVSTSQALPGLKSLRIEYCVAEIWLNYYKCNEGICQTRSSMLYRQVSIKYQVSRVTSDVAQISRFMRPEWDNLRKRNEISLYTTLYLPAAAANLSAQKKIKFRSTPDTWQHQQSFRASPSRLGYYRCTPHCVNATNE